MQQRTQNMQLCMPEPHYAHASKASMTTISDLPLGAVQRVLQLTRQRRIAGTNAYARVCRQWGEASSSDDLEPLQLFLDMSRMSDSEVADAFSWASMHGYQIDTLVVSARWLAAERLQSLWQPAAGCSRLRRLEVDPCNSLLLLAPVLGQLTHLQHLSAVVALDMGPSQLEDMPDVCVAGVFIDHREQVLEEVPNLQQLCPQLASLRLALRCECYEVDVLVDPCLSLLLPAHLQQLVLEDLYSEVSCMVVRSSSLQHLTALRELDLLKVGVAGLGSGTLAQDLPHLQQLRVHAPYEGFKPGWDPLQLGITVTEYWVPRDVPPAPIPQHLTRLVAVSDIDRPEAVTDALAAGHLQGLQELHVDVKWGRSTAAFLRHAAGLTSLRCLDLEVRQVASMRSSRGLGSALACCTQLTSLRLVSWYSHGCSPYHGPLLSGLQQLTGLCVLKIHARLVEQQAGAWLAPLTALTRLHVLWPDDSNAAAERKAVISAAPGEGQHPWVYRVACLLLQRWQVRPVSLRQVVFWGAFYGSRPCDRHCIGWMHTPSSSGAAPVGVWLDSVCHAASHWPRPFTPCPHLPGVWELPAKVEHSSE